MMRSSLAASWVALGLACAPAPAPASPPAPASAPASAPAYPTPYTSAQLRAASRAGRRYEFRLEEAGKPAIHLVFKTLRTSPEWLENESTVSTDDGKVVDGPKVERATWDELRAHAEFPRDAVTTLQADADTPAGKFASTVYVVTRGDVVRTFYFARDLAGPPVLWFTEKSGQRVMTTTLVRYDAGN